MILNRACGMHQHLKWLTLLILLPVSVQIHAQTDSRFTGPAVLVVEGIPAMSELSINLPSLQEAMGVDGRETRYLDKVAPKIKESMQGQGHIVSVSWDGHLENTRKIIDQTKTAILSLSRSTKADPDNPRGFAIVAHSWGSVIAYQAIKELEQDGKLPVGSIDQFTTMGSPLGKGGSKFLLTPSERAKLLLSGVQAKDLDVLTTAATGKVNVTLSVRNWTNYWTESDVVSGAIKAPGVVNKEVPKGFDDPHSVYYKNPGILGSVMGDLEKNTEEALAADAGLKKLMAKIGKEIEKAKQKDTASSKSDKNILPAKEALPAQYSEVDNRSPTGNPKVIATTTNYFAVATVFSPSSGSAHLLTATGFEMRRDVSNTSASYDTGSGYSGNIGTASVVDQGSDASGGNLNWGRWSGAGSTNVAAGITYTGQNFHYVFGSAPTNIPSSGSVTYNPVGGTSPTSSGGTNVAAGTAGTFNGGTIGVNFATRAVTVSNLNFSVSTATFNMNGSSTYNSNALFLGSLTGTCTGAACSGAVSGNHIGTLTGPTAAGVALGYQAYTAGTGMVVGAQGFKR